MSCMVRLVDSRPAMTLLPTATSCSATALGRAVRAFACAAAMPRAYWSIIDTRRLRRERKIGATTATTSPKKPRKIARRARPSPQRSLVLGM